MTTVIHRSAVFFSIEEGGGLYRLSLTRDFDRTEGPTIVFCCHNPSTAGEDREDATSRRMIRFADSWGAKKLLVVNPWAACATHPRDLWRMADPVGPGNDEVIYKAALEARETGGFVVVAWGAIKPPKKILATAQKRLKDVQELIERAGCPMKSLGITKDGFPKHPTRLAAGTSLNSWVDP